MEFVKDSVFNYNFSFESDIIDFKKYFGDFAKLLIPIETCQNTKCKSKENFGCEENCRNDEFYKKYLNISEEQLKELKQKTDVDHLTCDGEIEQISHDFYKKFNEENIKPKPKTNDNVIFDSSLISVAKRAELVNDIKFDFPRTFYKYCNYQWCINKEKPNEGKLDFYSDDFSAIVVCVKVYHPFLSTRTNPLKVKFLQEIQILGNQTLSELKDKIVCSYDYIGDRDMSMEYFLKEVGLNITAKDEYPSSFIFIENTFYNDFRSSKSADLSKEIRDWGSSRGLGEFLCSSMENTKISDVKLKIGRPYVFLHQGNCEHIIVFSDIRFLEMSDPSKLTSYPRIVSIGRIYGKHCMMCADSYARWLLVGNARLTHDKTFLCKKCFLSYNYLNGQKIGQFKAFKYVDPIALL